jgi:hypothetical protein
MVNLGEDNTVLFFEKKLIKQTATEAKRYIYYSHLVTWLIQNLYFKTQ